MYNKKVIMLILDGWGIGKDDKYNAIANANTPNFDKLEREYPNVRLRSDGEYVGLPEGQFGTSEINHQVIGAGKVVMQDLPRINTEIETGTFFDNEEFINICDHVNKHEGALHLVGIVSDGRVHAYNKHLYALLEVAKQEEVNQVYIHVFTDGRDTAPRSAEKYLDELEKKIKELGVSANIATIQGRVFLDRDRDWDKTKQAVDLIFKGEGMEVNDFQSAINFSYNQNVNDEYFEQFLLDKDGMVKKGDGVIFFHYRSDRMYQIQKEFIDRKLKNLKLVSFIESFESKKIDEAFPRPDISHTLARSISEADKNQYHLTETEKYTHLTFFLNAGREKEFKGETWELIQSNRFVKPYYNFDPIMKGAQITKRVIELVDKGSQDFIIVNFPNTDMVGHTGSYEAAVIAAESVDYCIGKIYEALEDKLDKYALIVTADHGNSDEMWDYEADQPHTQHTTNPVPFILVSDIDCRLDRKESLEDVAPTILDLMGIEKPESMTGSSLILKK